MRSFYNQLLYRRSINSFQIYYYVTVPDVLRDILSTIHEVVERC